MDESSGKQMRCHDVIINQPGLNQRIYGDVSKDQVFHGHTIGHDGEVVTTSNPWVIYETSLGVSTKKTSDVSWNAFGRFTQCKHHQSGNVPRKHLPKPTTGTHPRRLQKSPCSFCGDLLDLNGPQRFKGEQKTPVPHVRLPCQNVVQVTFSAKFCWSQAIAFCLDNSNPRWEFVASPTKNPFQRVTKGSCTWHGFRNRNLWFFKRPHFFFEF